jgi:CDP-diacylglycerol pyrophosphatase
VCFLSSRSIRLILICLAFIVSGFVPPDTAAADSRNILWNIVTTCVDLNATDYCTRCALPRIDSSCAHGHSCRDTTEVWQETADYVAIRDIKMCGCEREFVHGLAIPRVLVTGIEDPGRSDGIWSFAWAVARNHIEDELAIALTVNPPGLRSQDQLHVHIVRLLPDARRRFTDAKSRRVPSLDNIWNAAAEMATGAGFKGHGVLVTKKPEGDFLIVVVETSPEKLFTQWECHGD